MSRRDTATPRRRKKSVGSRLGRFWILALVIAVLVGIAAYFATTWSGFEPKHVAVTGNGTVPAADVVAAAAIDPARNLWLQDARAIATRVETIPIVDVATVHRGLPATVTIAVTLRQPAFSLRAAGSTYVVDRALRVLYPAGDVALCPCIVLGKPLALRPGAFVTDAQATAMRDDLAALAAAHVDPVELRYDKYESLIVKLRDGTMVLLGDDGVDLAKKVALIGPIRSQLARGRPILAIDLRAPNTPVVKYK